MQDTIPDGLTQSPDTLVWGPEKQQQCLREITPKLGRYGWLIQILQTRFRQNGFFPNRLYAAMQRLVDVRKPYFIGTSSEGIRFLGDFRESYSVFMAITPNRDAAFLQFMQQKIAPAGDYLDIGCNMGLTASLMARTLKDRTVYAFEPDPETATRAAATFALNGLENVRVCACALGDSDGELTFYKALNHSDMASFIPEVDLVSEWREIKVTCRTVDSLVAEGILGRVGLIKIDVEGYELHVMRGAQHLIAQNRPPLVYEYNFLIAPKMGWTVDDIAALCPGYRFQVLEDDGSLSAFDPAATGCTNMYGEPTEG